MKAAKRKITGLLLLALTTFFLIIFCSDSQGSTLLNYVRANPNNPEILNSYGIELANAGNLTEAIRVWRRALDFAPRNVHLYNNIGSALKRLGHDEHAYKWYAAALEIQPTYWTYYNLAIIYRDRNQSNDAAWALKQSLQLNPSFTQAQDLLRRLETGLIQATAAVKTPVSVYQRPPEASPADAVVPAKPSRQTEVKVADKTVAKKHYSAPASPSSEKALQLPDDGGGQVFLTFDGGADDDGFDTIMACLAGRNAKCTFFLTGKFALRYPEKAQRLLAQGHEIANHSMNHPDMKNFATEKISAEIEAAEQAFEKVTGRRGAPFFRFPFGHQNKRVEKIVETLGYRPVYWHIDTIDWREDPVNTIIGRVEKKLRRGSVILMHIGSKNGAKALNRILDIIAGRGYTFARLSDLDPSQLASLP